VPKETVILGVDSGLRNLGWGVVEFSAGRARFRDAGVVKVKPAVPAQFALATLYAGLTDVVAEHCPDEAAIEDVFFGRNRKSAMATASARGVALLVLAQHDVTCVGFNPGQAKKAVTGSGVASKDEVRDGVAAVLGLDKGPASDHAADACAVALKHASTLGLWDSPLL
jgi:crossover junction endodeoxyribonuclease RuvC